MSRGLKNSVRTWIYEMSGGQTAFNKAKGEIIMFQAGFIYVFPGLDPEKQNAQIPSDEMNMNVIGVSDYDAAEKAATELVAKGCTAIELCAGFGVEGLARIKKAVGPGVAVGAVRFDFHPGLEFKSGDDVF